MPIGMGRLKAWQTKGRYSDYYTPRPAASRNGAAQPPRPEIGRSAAKVSHLKDGAGRRGHETSGGESGIPARDLPEK